MTDSNTKNLEAPPIQQTAQNPKSNKEKEWTQKDENSDIQSILDEISGFIVLIILLFPTS